jgi:hypothetical protein
MALMHPMTDDRHQQPRHKVANLRTALVLLSIAAVFFAGIIINRVFFV